MQGYTYEAALVVYNAQLAMLRARLGRELTPFETVRLYKEIML